MFKDTLIITGASRGIGEKIFEIFAKEPYNIIVNCKNNISMLEELANKYKNINENIVAVCSDVSEYTGAEKLVQVAHEKFPNASIKTLINNAGISNINLFTDTNTCDWDNIIKTNLYSVMNLTHLVTPYMVKNQNGSVINISSIWGSVGASCEAVYSASKGGVNSFSKAIGKELAPSGITVNAIACGVIDTQMNSFLTKEEKEELIDSIPVGRMGKAEEVAQLCLFLSKSKYITGQIITIDGGLT